jgi:glyoxylase-like metal-dependent hydrolase (beta-lactamase superfamily II)
MRWEACEVLTPIHPPYQSPVEVAPGIFLVAIPIPIPLKYVNCYLMRGPSGWTLVDTGFHDALAEEAWPRAFADLSIRPQDVNQILITHYHPDHLGAAGWLQQLTGAPAYMHAPEFRQVELFWGEEMAVQAEKLVALFAGEGMPAEVAQAIGQHHHHQFGQVQPLPLLQPIETGATIPLGEGQYEVIHAPGHSDGLAIFYDKATGVLLANDMILAKITPNVSLWPGCHPDPLAAYLRSLEMVERLGARIALPGHRTVITDVSARAAEIRHHHGERLEKMAAITREFAGGATAWEVCERVFTPATLTVHQVRFAMSETLAHLVYMVGQGRMVKEGMRYREV